jgi:F-type H+-transporting ATPase subunit b
MDIQLSQVLFQMINFGVVFAALTYFLYKPVTKMLDERATRAAEAEKIAANAAKEREEIEELKTKVKSQADKEAVKTLDKVKEQAASLKKELTSQARDEAKAEKQSALHSMEKEFSQAVFAVAEKVVGKSLDKKAHADLIDKSLKEIAKVA